MGVGKSTISKKLSKEFNMVALDTDNLIESSHKKSIKEIFEENGEKYFREQEQKIANWIENSVTNTIISTGGGFFMVENIKKIGTIVYLKSSYEDIMRRIMNHPNAKNKLLKRPLLADQKKAKELFRLREPKYLEIADIVVDFKNHKNIKNILEEIVKYYKGKFDIMDTF